MASPPTDRPPPIDAGQALFLDLDGGLVGQDFTDARRASAIKGAVRRLSGAVAVLSSRTLPQIDRILQQACTAAAGVHGLARRTGEGRVISFAAAPGLHRAKTFLGALVQTRPGLVLEDKGHSLALDYRRAPEAEAAVREAIDRLAAAPDLARQDGDMTCELCTAGPDGGESLRAFLSEAPFQGRKPVALGGLHTDARVFAAAQDLGGYGVFVGAGPSTAARYRLDGVGEAMAWLQTEAA